MLMKKLAIFILFAVAFGSRPAYPDSEIVVLQGIRVKPYADAIEGFAAVCDCKFKQMVLSEMPGADIRRKIDKLKPRMVLAVGMQALAEARKIRDIPVVYLMVLNPQAMLAGESNITGVSMHIPPDKQLAALVGALPDATNIGLLYDPDRSGAFAQEARHAAAKIGLNLIARQIRDPSQAPDLILGMKDKIDVFWMLPDVTVATPETVEFLLLFSFENKVPIFTFSEKYVEMGAFMSMDIDARDMGRQAGEMAKAILAGADVNRIKPVYAARAVVSTNVMIARKLGIKLTLAMMSGAKINEKVFRRVQSIN